MGHPVSNHSNLMVIRFGFPRDDSRLKENIDVFLVLVLGLARRQAGGAHQFRDHKFHNLPGIYDSGLDILISTMPLVFLIRFR